MSERVLHDEGELKDAPKWLRWSMAFINRVGFPIVVCIFLAWLTLFKMEEGKDATNKLANAILLLNKTLEDSPHLAMAKRNERIRD